MWNLIHGSPDDLRALSTGIHDRGMYLMVDAVANRMGYAGPSHHVDYSRVVQFNSNSIAQSRIMMTKPMLRTVVLGMIRCRFQTLTPQGAFSTARFLRLFPNTPAP
ncbi:hypothetical protein ACO22_02308 [Paracoccidioides brasiliensis]|uniref:Uncharacterized protein n=1 Tax=Paracoccidioides brasiliensis TaxID=121759 RepID=A0A1D2JJI5_PARBR|nr:hypothetical protein ACO22_02308 [Paracoccidioides brasiliensis]